jgi:hypothetical protein
LRDDIRPLTELEERRRAGTAARPSEVSDEIGLSAKHLECQARNEKITEMWLAGNGYKEIEEAKHSVGSIICKLGLQGKGCHCKRPFVVQVPG